MKLRQADYGWLTVAAVVLVVEATAEPGELLSEGVDRYLARRPWLTRTAVVLTAAHLLNLLPARVDPFYRVAVLFGR
ncbi:hypothetical protein B1R94_02435 [Mycolicibacterium litorale]|nr:hypothetical protein B1R94_02435 [Mycolicibacterium litorale]